MGPGQRPSTYYASTSIAIVVKLTQYLPVSDFLAFCAKRLADVLRDFPRRTRISLFALDAFFNFVRQTFLCQMPAGVVIVALRAHFEPVNL
jgi:hypothetical protein